MIFFVKRLHDINHSGMWILLILVPRILSHIPGYYWALFSPRQIIDTAIILYLLFRKGTEGVNDYGEKPKSLF